MTLLYRLALACYALAIKLATLFSLKARFRQLGNTQWRPALQQLPPSPHRLWLHVASVGEFEQGRPLVEQFLQRHPHYQLILTFFSPSGYQQHANYSHAALATYLPLDSPSNAKAFLDLLQPQLVFFVKYEFWHFFLRELKARQIPCLLLAAHFRPNQAFFRWYGTFFRQMLHCFEHIFVQQTSNLPLLKAHGIHHASHAGDSRIDRVFEIATTPFHDPIIASFSQNHLLFIAGSSWPIGEQALLKHIQQAPTDNWKYLIAPHDVSPKHIEQLQALFGHLALRYTQSSEQEVVTAKVLIVDTIGLLSKLYRYGAAAYIGGGFGQGIHNTLEPAVYGLPIAFGPKHEKFVEAKDLLEAGAAVVVKRPEEMGAMVKKLQGAAFKEGAAKAAKAYVEGQRGATGRMLNWIETYLLEAPK